MRYLSVCSGIEAASIAWHRLGWTPVGFSEIEPFPSAVLAHRFPNVPNFGDMTKFQEWPIEPGTIDVLVGGTPCQSFSVAGLRAGLSDPRGGLMLTYLEIAQRLRPRWIVWENVPGVLSSGGGRDFGAFLGALGELGYGWAYRVLDAQWCRTHGHPRAVPQRRRRVFVVGHFGDWSRAAAVLFERESVRRDSAPRRAKGQGAAADAEAGAGAGCYWDGSDIANTLTRKGCDDRMPDKDRLFAVLQPVGYRWQNDCDGLVEDGTAPSCRASAGSSGFHEMNHPVVVQPFTKSKRAQSTTDDETWVDGQVNPTLSLFDQGDTRATTVAIAFKPGQSAEARTIGAQVGVACTLEAGGGGNNKQAVAHAVDVYNQTIDGDCAATLTEACGGTNTSGPKVMAFKPGQSAEARSLGAQVDVACTLEAGGGGNNKQAVAHAVAPTITAANDPSRSPQSSEVTQQVAAVHAASMTVRRLTPRECERLQGFPDDYTAIPWRRKPAAECPDGPRYKALGNSMAVNCMAWIGERIAAVDSRHDI